MKKVSITSVYNLFLDIDKKYKDVINNVIHIAVIFFSVIFLKDTVQPGYISLFLYVIAGQLFYDLVISHIFKIY